MRAMCHFIKVWGTFIKQGDTKDWALGAEREVLSLHLSQVRYEYACINTVVKNIVLDVSFVHAYFHSKYTEL